MNEDPNAIRKEADEILRREFGFAPRSTLTTHDDASWGALKRKRGHKDGSDSQLVGWYFIREREAHVWMGNPTWVANLYHELHGHGLFYEHSRLSAVCAKTDHGDRLQGDGWGMDATRFDNSEGFATWMEGYLCRETGRERTLALVESSMPRAYRHAYEQAKELECALSPAGFLRQMGIPVPIDKIRAKDIVRAASANKRVELALLVGAPQPDDPVRVLIVSDDRPTLRERPWLKPHVLESERFIDAVVRRDTGMTAQIKGAQLLYGDAWAFEKAKARLTAERDTPLS